MTVWVVGDIHGCADELGDLVQRLALGPDDRLLAVGDLFHRGPDPCGVMERLDAAGAAFVLGNHEHVVLRRAGLAPTLPDGSDRPPPREAFPPLVEDDLAGDGGRPLVAPRERLGELLGFLQRHAGFAAGSATIEGARPTPDGRPWWVVHAGVTPGRGPLESEVRDLLYPPRVRGLRRRSWTEVLDGGAVVVYGHVPVREVREHRVGGRVVAVGVDTGCVYGGSLSAYSPEEGRVVAVRARRTYAER